MRSGGDLARHFPARPRGSHWHCPHQHHWELWCGPWLSNIVMHTVSSIITNPAPSVARPTMQPPVRDLCSIQMMCQSSIHLQDILRGYLHLQVYDASHHAAGGMAGPLIIGVLQPATT